MKDLLLYAADADTAEFLGALLARPQAMQIRSITVQLERHIQRDAGMVSSGPELAGLYKGQFSKVMLVLDFHGCGREHRESPEQVAERLQERLDRVSWRAHSDVTVVKPEIERWIWQCPAAIAAHYKVSAATLEQWVSDRAASLKSSGDALQADQPKELFEHVVRERVRRTISPRDFSAIGNRASVRALLGEPSFARLAAQLRAWFPPR